MGQKECNGWKLGADSCGGAFPPLPGFSVAARKRETRLVQQFAAGGYNCIASNSSIMPAITSKPPCQKAGSVMSTPASRRMCSGWAEPP